MFGLWCFIINDVVLKLCFFFFSLCYVCSDGKVVFFSFSILLGMSIKFIFLLYFYRNICSIVRVEMDWFVGKMDFRKYFKIKISLD